MPKRLERRLRRSARKLYPNDKEAQDRYVYGALNNMGLLHKPEEKKEDKSE